MNKNYLSACIVFSGLLISGAIIGVVHAQTAAQNQPPQQREPNDIQFPIKELGNCKSKEACKTFCDNSENSDACFAFAGQHNLMTSEEVDHAKKFKDGGMVGPGGCKGQASCDQYCGNGDHMEECIAFAQKNGMMSSQQLEESKKVLTAIKNGVKPPACGGPKQCDAYCGSSEHMEECMNFSLAAGLMPDNQKEQMQKTLAAIKRGVKPPACRGPQECDTYCNNPEHMEECVNFAVESGMMPDDQKEQMQKTLGALKQGIKPPACQPNRPDQSGQRGGPNDGQGFNPGSGENGNGPGRGQGGPNGQSNQSDNGLPSCDQYCGEDSHVEECVKFSVAVGNMTEDQAKISIKTRGKGPGGCVGREACDAFCGNPDNQETCFNFGKENGMIPQEDLQRMQDGQQRMKDSFSSIPPEVVDCLTSTVGADVVEKMKTGSVNQRSMGDAINQCFQKFGVREGTPSGNGPGSDQGGQSDQNQNDQGQQGQFNQPGQNRSQNDLSCSPKGTAAAFVCATNGRNASGGSETTYFNACTAKQDGAEIIHEGVCEGQKPCADVANPVCGNDGHTWVSACYAEEQGGGVKHEGVCEGSSNQQNQNQQGQPGQRGQGQGGPNQGQGFNPGSGENGNGQGRGQGGQSSQNQQGQFNQGQNKGGPGGTNPGGRQMPQQAGPGGCKGPEECQKYCTANPDVCKNFQPPQNQQGQRGQGGSSGQPNRSGQPNQPGQSGQQNQSGQQRQNQQMNKGQLNQSGQGGGGSGPCGTGPGTCSGIGPDDVGGIGQPGQMQQGQQQMQQQFNQGQPGQPGQFNPLNEPRQLNEFNPTNQPGQFNPPVEMQPQQQPQFQPPPQLQEPSAPPPPPPSSFLQRAQQFFGSVTNTLR